MTKGEVINEEEDTRDLAIKLIKQGESQADVMRITGISRASFFRYKILAAKSKKIRKYPRKSGSGRHQRLTKGQKISIHNYLRFNPFQSTIELANKLSSGVHFSTVFRYLVSAGFKLKKTSSHFTLDPKDEDDRLVFGLSMLDFLFFDHIVFVDETTLWLHDDNLAGWFHKEKRNPLSIERHSGKINVFGAISLLGKICIRLFRTNLNSSLYSKILVEDLLPNVSKRYPFGWFLAQDNNTAHAGEAVNILETQVPYILDWPPRSPDLSPIETLWGILKRRVRKRQAKSLDDLEKFILEEWDLVSKETIERLCESFPKRIRKLVEVEGKKVYFK